MIVVVVPKVERQVAMDSLDRAGAIQTSRATGANRMIDSLFGKMLNDVASAASRDLGVRISSRLP